MICTVVKGPTLPDAQQQMIRALAYSDLVELRLDHFSDWSVEALQKLLNDCSIPIIFTLRSQLQGGHYPYSEKMRLDAIQNLALLGPDYMDIESHVPEDFAKTLFAKHPKIKFILSHHNFQETPSRLDETLIAMKKIPAHCYKIAVAAKNTTDAIRFLCWAKAHKNLIAISMGFHGQISRIAAPLLGDHSITYASLEENEGFALGQLSARILVEKYNYRHLTDQLAIYGLIGNPVDKSISDDTHNAFFREVGIDAVYVKMPVAPEELSEFMTYAKQLPYKGLSVTMPLKEQIIGHLDHIDTEARKIGAVNTLVFEDGKILGYNTDGIGALEVIEERCHVQDKRMIILGAGGAAKALAYEATKRGALVTVLNRNPAKAVEIAKRFNCKGRGLDEMSTCVSEGYDILINCTPSSMPIDSMDILPGTIVMDTVVTPKETDFLKHAQIKGCQLIYGTEMFFAQARGQFKLWFS